MRVANDCYVTERVIFLEWNCQGWKFKGSALAFSRLRFTLAAIKN
jgi:hypothetical protein